VISDAKKIFLDKTFFSLQQALFSDCKKKILCQENSCGKKGFLYQDFFLSSDL